MKRARGDDIVFRALADESRRELLDLVKGEPGLTVGELAARFPFTRFALMKHIRTLETANLLVSRREGKRKRLYLNGVPLQQVYDRWMSKYSAFWARRLTALRRDLEQEEKLMVNDPKHVHVIYIRTTVDDLWRAITSSKMTTQYFFHSAVESDFKPGSPIRYYMDSPDGKREIPVAGEILECVPKSRLSHSFVFHGEPGPPSRVTYEIEQAGPLVKLTVVHDQFGDNRRRSRAPRTAGPSS